MIPLYNKCQPGDVISCSLYGIIRPVHVLAFAKHPLFASSFEAKPSPSRDLPSQIHVSGKPKTSKFLVFCVSPKHNFQNSPCRETKASILLGVKISIVSFFTSLIQTQRKPIPIVFIFSSIPQKFRKIKENDRFPV